jgi:hypothetical protein
LDGPPTIYFYFEPDKNSFGFCSRMGIEGSLDFEDDGLFEKGDVVGIGIINPSANSPMKYFTTLNGNLHSAIFESKLNGIRIRKGI